MHATVSILLAAVLTVHSVGGLCWQHAGLDDHCTKSPSAVSFCGCGKHVDPPVDGAGFRRQSNDGCRSECTGSCRYSQAKRVVVEASPLTLCVQPMVFDSETARPQSIFDIFERGAITRGGCPPLRLHLINGILLI